jgi:hypothetical protein
MHSEDLDSRAAALKDDDDDVLERLEQELDDDFDLAALREKRLQEMHAA